MNTTPEAVKRALNHVREHYPDVTQVFYGRDQIWLFCDDRMESPAFGPEINVDLLCEAMDSVPSLPAAYAWEP